MAFEGVKSNPEAPAPEETSERARTDVLTGAPNTTAPVSPDKSDVVTTTPEQTPAPSSDLPTRLNLPTGVTPFLGGAPEQRKQTMKDHMRGILGIMLENLAGPKTEQGYGPHGEMTDEAGNRITQTVPTAQRVMTGIGRVMGGMSAGMAAGRGPGGAFRAASASFNKEEEMKNESDNRRKQLMENNLTLYRAYRQHVADEAETQGKNSAVAAPTVEGLRSAISTGKFKVTEAKGVLGSQVTSTIATLNANHPELEAIAYPTGQNAEGKNIYSIFYGDLHDLKLTANDAMSKQLGIAVGAEVSLPAIGQHVAQQISETNMSHLASRELGDNPWDSKLDFEATVDGKTFKGEKGRDQLLSSLEPEERQRVQKSFALWSKIHTQTYRDPEADLKALDKIDPTAAGDIDKYLYGEGNITKLHNAIADYGVRAKTEAQKDLENGPLTTANSQSIIAMANADPTRFKPERVTAAKEFLAGQHAQMIDKSLEGMETKPSEMAGENSLAAKAQLQGLMQDETVVNDPKLAVRVNRLMTVADKAHKAWQRDKIETNAAMVAQQEYQKNGDPAMAGKMLLDHNLTLQDMKNRNLDTKFIESAVDWAVKHSPDPAHPYSAGAANAQENAAKNAKFVDFFGNSDSLIRPGGTLDQLSRSGARITEHDFQVLNKAKNWVDLQAGHPDISAYAATALGVADDYAKVLGGSVGSDTARSQVLAIIDPSLSNAQREAAIKAMRDSVYSQRSSKIGNNPFLEQMYGTIPAETPQGTVKATPNAPAAPPPPTKAGPEATKYNGEQWSKVPQTLKDQGYKPALRNGVMVGYGKPTGDPKKPFSDLHMLNQ